MMMTKNTKILTVYSYTRFGEEVYIASMNTIDLFKDEKFANTPESCFIFNDEITDLKTPKNLNKQWYIDLANKRLTDFGVFV